jgi:hypothetical protein
MSSQNNNDLYKSAEDRANTAFDPNNELYKIHRCLKNARIHWVTEVSPSRLQGVEYNDRYLAWLKDEYGVDLQLNGGISGYIIVDEQKFLMFMLKFQ